VRCEQRKQECIYQKHKKRGPKPKATSGRKTKPKKRARSLSTNISNGRLKGKTKQRKLDQDYDDEEDEDCEDYGNVPTKLEIVPQGEVQVWIVMANSENEVSFLMDPSLTVEKVKQQLIKNSIHT